MTEADETMGGGKPPGNQLRTALRAAWAEAFRLEAEAAAADEPVVRVAARAVSRLRHELDAMLPPAERGRSMSGADETAQGAADRAARASSMLLNLTDQHGTQAKALALSLFYMVDDREGLAGIEDLASVLADHAARLSDGVEQVRAMLNGGGLA